MSVLTDIVFAISIVAVWAQTSKIFRTQQLNTESQILGRIFHNGYDKDSRPPVRDSVGHTAITVVVSIYINRIVWGDHNAEVDLYLRQQWQDSRLAYIVDANEEIKEVVVPRAQEIWTPDTYFTTGDDTLRRDRRRIVIEPSGYVRSSEMHTMKIPVRYGDRFPFVNRRQFSLRLSSYNYPLYDVAYVWTKWSPIEFSEDVLEGPFGRGKVEYPNCTGNYTVGMYSCVEAVITFKGSHTEALVKIFIPSMFLIISSWFHFWIYGSWSVPRTFSAAIPFFIFAAVLVFYPQPYLSAEGVGGIQVWFLFCLIITFASFIEYFIVICCGVRRIIRYTNGIASDETPLTTSREGTEIAYDTKCAKFKQNNGVDVMARVAFPLVFILFVVGFLILYLL